MIHDSGSMIHDSSSTSTYINIIIPLLLLIRPIQGLGLMSPFGDLFQIILKDLLETCRSPNRWLMFRGDKNANPCHRFHPIPHCRSSSPNHPIPEARNPRRERQMKNYIFVAFLDPVLHDLAVEARFAPLRKRATEP